MARIRTIKPEFYTNEALSAQPESVHLAAGGLLTYADDFGYFNANPGLVRAAIFPLREPSVSVPEILRRLQDIGYIRVYSGSDGKTYGHVVEFDKHQRVSHPTESKIKPLCLSPEILRNPPETFRPEQGTGNREQGKEQGTGKAADAAGAQGFDDFWNAYPKKVGKGAAEKAWLKLRPDAELQAEMLFAVAQQAFSDQWRRGFIPNPATWLNEKRWGDALPSANDKTRNLIEEAEALAFGHQ